jgi:hypothetical protein
VWSSKNFTKLLLASSILFLLISIDPTHRIKKSLLLNEATSFLEVSRILLASALGLEKPKISYP